MSRIQSERHHLERGGERVPASGLALRAQRPRHLRIEGVAPPRTERLALVVGAAFPCLHFVAGGSERQPMCAGLATGRSWLSSSSGARPSCATSERGRDLLELAFPAGPRGALGPSPRLGRPYHQVAVLILPDPAVGVLARLVELHRDDIARRRTLCQNRAARQ